jgi:hypothetical protein
MVVGSSLRAASLLVFLGAASCWIVGCSLSVLEGLSGGGELDEAGSSIGFDAGDSGHRENDTSVADAFIGHEVFYDDGSPVGSRDAQPTDRVRDAEDAGCPEPCMGKGYCLGSECVYASCKDRLAAFPTSASGVYPIDPDLGGGDLPFSAFCKMDVTGGGWTLLVKVDGHKSTFNFDSPLWESTTTFHPELPDLDENEAKLHSYSTLPFSALLVGMHDLGGTRWTVLSLGGSSLRDLMATSYHPSALGRDAWMKLPGGGSLQPFCNLEGVNANTPQARIRLGILANQQNDCTSCDSFIGFGGQYSQENMACGNLAYKVPDAGDRVDPDVGYVMAR